MDKIEFGATLPAAKGIPEFARKAESLGYDYLGAGEHMMFHGPISNSIIGLSVAAGATTKIKLMSTVVLLPLYNPMVLARTRPWGHRQSREPSSAKSSTLPSSDTFSLASAVRALAHKARIN